jgi:hypothetical protein
MKKIVLFIKKVAIYSLFFCSVLYTPLQAGPELVNSETVSDACSLDNHTHTVYRDAYRLRKHIYSSLYWLVLNSTLYYKLHENHPWIAAFFGILAIDSGINMLHYYHEAQCAALEEERIFLLIKEYISYYMSVS